VRPVLLDHKENRVTKGQPVLLGQQVPLATLAKPVQRALKGRQGPQALLVQRGLRVLKVSKENREKRDQRAPKAIRDRRGTKGRLVQLAQQDKPALPVRRVQRDRLGLPDLLVPLGHKELLVQPARKGMPSGAQGPTGPTGLLGDTLAHAVLIDSGGYFKIGSGTKDVDLDGIQIDDAELVGQENGVDQVRLGTDGRLMAGGGDVWLDEDGLTLRASTARDDPRRQVKWDTDSQINAILESVAASDSEDNYIFVQTEWVSNGAGGYYNNTIQITAGNLDGEYLPYSVGRVWIYGFQDPGTFDQGMVLIAPYLEIQGPVDIKNNSIIASEALGCQVYRSTTQSINSDTWDNPISYDTEIEDTDGCWSSGNPTRLVSGHDGCYVVSASFVLETSNLDDKRVYAGIRKNGTHFVAQDMARSDAGAGSVPRTITRVVKLEAGEYVEICVYHDVGIAKNIRAANASSLCNNSVSFYRLP